MCKIKISLTIEQADNPLLHDDLSTKKIRARAKRLEKLAYLGLCYEKKVLKGISTELAIPKNISADAIPPVAEIVSVPTNTNPVSANVESKADAVLVVPDGFGEDMSDLFTTEISLNVN
jgi:hypothetical protein